MADELPGWPTQVSFTLGLPTHVRCQCGAYRHVKDAVCDNQDCEFRKMVLEIMVSLASKVALSEFSNRVNDIQTSAEEWISLTQLKNWPADDD